MQFVVHEAFETMWCGAVVAGVVHAEDDREVGVGRGRRDDDFLGSGVEVLLRASRFVKKPVDSRTTSTPSSPHGNAAGSRSESIFICSPPR